MKTHPKPLRMTHTSGLKLSGRSVNYAFVIQPNPETKSALGETIHGEPKEVQAGSQTMRAPLRVCPVIISIGTKPPFSEGTTAHVWLAVRVAAGLTKLGQLLPLDQTRRGIPTLAAHGHELRLYPRERERIRI